MKLNVQNWQEFQINKLFTVEYGNSLELESCEETTKDDPEKVNFVARTRENNGVTAYVKRIPNIEPSKAGIITVAGSGSSTLSTFVQESDFYSGYHLFLLIPKDEYSKEVKQFISICLELDKYKYWYGRQANKTLPFIKIKLPVQHDSNGLLVKDDSCRYSDKGSIPDWQFMEDFIKSLHHKPLTTKNKAGDVPDLSVDQWMPFITSRLFYLFENGKANQQMLDDGKECFYVGAKRDNNGVMLHCQKDEALITRGNCIVFICNGEGSVGFANYMDVDFIGTTDIVAGYNENLNPYVGLFLATVYSQERPKYSFGRKWKTHLTDTEIKLPVRRYSDGTIYHDDSHKWSDAGYVPDWQFMENYIKALPYGDRLVKISNT